MSCAHLTRVAVPGPPMSNHKLQVFDGQFHIGQVIYDALDEQFSFHYTEQWLGKRGAYPLSPHFPLNGAHASSGTVRRFIENLLPEGRALDIAAAHHNVTKNNVYGLIRQLGQETAGALSFLAERQHNLQAVTQKREVTVSELADRIARRNEVPFAVWDGKVRMSMAGYQDKLPVYHDGDRLFLVEGALSSTHILKPEPADERMPFLVANEHFCMTLASRLGLNSAPVAILRLPSPVLLVERFDRLRTDQVVTRVHIIDACQALDFPVAYKYEQNLGSGKDVRNIRDGVSYPTLFSLQDKSSSKARTIRTLANWALLQFLIGNSDAHGKNYSFFCRPEGLEPTPLYDLVSVVQYAGIEHAMAMAYGDEFVLAKITPYAFADFAHRTGLERRFLSREMKRLARLALHHAPRLAADPVYLGGETEIVGQIAAYVVAQAEKLIDLSTKMLEVDRQYL